MVRDELRALPTFQGGQAGETFPVRRDARRKCGRDRLMEEQEQDSAARTDMISHLRAATLTTILAGGTLAAYFTVYAMLQTPAVRPDAAAQAVADRSELAVRVGSGRTDVSAREACSAFEDSATRSRCMQEIGGVTRPVRIIGLAQAAVPRSESRTFLTESDEIQTGRSVSPKP
jgi:hypothetical protein